MILSKSFDSLSRARALKRALQETGARAVRLYRHTGHWVVEWTA
jgi:hypothetical protein